MTHSEAQAVAEREASHASAPVSRLPRQLSDSEFALLANAGERRELMPGQTVFRRGEFGRAMFVIEPAACCWSSPATCRTS